MEKFKPMDVYLLEHPNATLAEYKNYKNKFEHEKNQLKNKTEMLIENWFEKLNGKYFKVICGDEERKYNIYFQYNHKKAYLIAPTLPFSKQLFYLNCYSVFKDAYGKYKLTYERIGLSRYWFNCPYIANPSNSENLPILIELTDEEWREIEKEIKIVEQFIDKL